MAKFKENECIELRNSTLEQAKTYDFEVIATIIGTNCCKGCDEINGLTMLLEELVATPILPYQKCTRNNFCICCYGFKAKRDKNNRIILK